MTLEARHKFTNVKVKSYSLLTCYWTVKESCYSFNVTKAWHKFWDGELFLMWYYFNVSLITRKNVLCNKLHRPEMTSPSSCHETTSPYQFLMSKIKFCHTFFPFKCPFKYSLHYKSSMLTLKWDKALKGTVSN